MNMDSRKSLLKTFSCSQCQLELFRGAEAVPGTMSDKQTEEINPTEYRTVCSSHQMA
jgi:hypothetical protein